MSPTLRSFEVKFSGGARTLCAVGPGALAELPALCAQAGLSGASQLVCDARLLELQEKAVQALAAHFGAPLPRPVSEAGKSLAEVEAICNALAARNLGRDSFLLALGGGVLTDLAGLAAARIAELARAREPLYARLADALIEARPSAAQVAELAASAVRSLEAERAHAAPPGEAR